MSLTRIFIGKLSRDVTEDMIREECERLEGFSRVEMKQGFAFAFFNDPDSANTAIGKLNGITLGGSPIICEPGRARERRDNASTGGARMRSDHRLIVRDIDQRTSWQNLKDWARPAGEVNFVDVVNRGGDRIGIIEFTNGDSLQNALRDLVNTPLDGNVPRISADESGEFAAREPNRGRDGGRGPAGDSYNGGRFNDRSDWGRGPEGRDRRGESRERGPHGHGGRDDRDRDFGYGRDGPRGDFRDDRDRRGPPPAYDGHGSRRGDFGGYGDHRRGESRDRRGPGGPGDFRGERYPPQQGHGGGFGDYHPRDEFRGGPGGFRDRRDDFSTGPRGGPGYGGPSRRSRSRSRSPGRGGFQGGHGSHGGPPRRDSRDFDNRGGYGGGDMYNRGGGPGYDRRDDGYNNRGPAGRGPR